MAKTKTADWEDLTAHAEGGLSANQIATRLNAAELTTSEGKKWYDSTVLYVFRAELDGDKLKSKYPKLAEDAAKYDAKQADKKKKAKAKVAAKAKAVQQELDTTTKPKVLVAKKESDEAVDKVAGIMADAAKDVAVMARKALPEGPAAARFAVVAIGHGRAYVKTYSTSEAALTALLEHSTQATMVTTATLPAFLSAAMVTRVDFGGHCG